MMVRDGRYRGILRPGLSRRDLIERGAGLAGAALVGGALNGPAAAQDKPAKGGTLRLGLGGGSTTDSLDPRSYTDSVMIDVGHGIFNGLVEWAANGKPVPELAESWEASDGAKVWTFNLRRDIPFSNGKIFDADDAVYSLNMHRGETKSGGAGPMKVVSDVKKMGPNQIQVILDAGDADFPYVLTDYHIMMVPNGHGDWSKPIGSGAFTVEQFNPGVRIVLKQRPGGYWKPDCGLLDAVQVTVINDGSARLNALITGQIDACNRVDPKAVALVERSKTVEILRAPGGWHPVMAMQVDKAPFDNLDLRLAIKYATNREQMAKTLFSGFATLGNDHPIPKGDPYFNSELPQRAYDPDKAAFHLKKAGIADPKIVLQASDAAFNGAVDMATLLQASAGKAGVKVDVKKEPADGFWDNVWLKGAFVSSYWGGRAAATQMLGVAFKSGAPWNESRWNDPAFEKLLSDARAEVDEAKRRPYIWEMQAILSERGGALIPAFRDWIDGKSKKVGGMVPTSGFDMSNGYVCERAWMRA